MKLEIEISDAPVRWWTLDNGGVTYTVAAPDSTSAMLFVLNAERLSGSHDEITELEVEELTGERLWACHFNDEDGNRQHVTKLELGGVCCSEWP